MGDRAAKQDDLTGTPCPAGGPPVLNPFDPDQVEWRQSDDASAFLFAAEMRIFCIHCQGGLWAFGDGIGGVIAAHYHPEPEAHRRAAGCAGVPLLNPGAPGYQTGRTKS